jgi:hypothetical protein
MTGTHGSLWQYLKAYQVYGGTPPIPAEADESRGETRPKVLLYPVMAVTAQLKTGFLPLFSRRPE